MTATLLADDPRIDPRLKAVFGGAGSVALPDVADRAEMLAEVVSEAGIAAGDAIMAFFASVGSEAVAPSRGLIVRTEPFRSTPDNNLVNILLIRPEGSDVLPCIYYIHGGGMQALSAYDANYQVWGRMIAAQGVAVAMIDFRNALRPSSAPEIAPYPAGLNDCAAGLDWVLANGVTLGVDPARVVVAGDSGGANLALALALRLNRARSAAMIQGVYALAPFIAGQWPLRANPSSSDNEGIFIALHTNRDRIVYGIEAFEARDPLAWPGFANADDVRGLPPVVINVNECDPLRDEGLAFYRLLLASGVRARCRQSMGTVHATEVFPAWCPDISADLIIYCNWFRLDVCSSTARACRRQPDRTLAVTSTLCFPAGTLEYRRLVIE